MKIRKNGKIVNLTESDLRRIVKRVMNEGEILVEPNSIQNKLKGVCINTWRRSPGKKGVNSESDWDESWKIQDVKMAADRREDNWGDKLTIILNKDGDCKFGGKNSKSKHMGDNPDITATLTLVCDGQRNAKSYSFDFEATGRGKENFKSGPRFNQGISNVLIKNEWCKYAGVEDSPGKAEDEFASTGSQYDQQMSESRRKYRRK